MILLSPVCLLTFSLFSLGFAFQPSTRWTHSFTFGQSDLAVGLRAVAHRGQAVSTCLVRGNKVEVRQGPRSIHQRISHVDVTIRELQNAQSVANVHTTLAEAAANRNIKLVHVNQAIGRLAVLGGTSMDVDRLLKSLAEHGLTPDVFTYATAIAACSDKRTQQADWRRAVTLLHDMQAGGLTPDGVCYGAAAAACARGRSNAAAEAALALVERFKADLGAAEAFEAVPENTKGSIHSQAAGDVRKQGSLSRSTSHVYVSAMKACGHAGRWEASLQLFDELGELEGEKKHRSAFAWTAAVAACGSAGQWQRAIGLLDEMANELGTVTPASGRQQRSSESYLGDPTATYNAAITACGRAGQWQTALAVFNRIRPEVTSEDTPALSPRNAPSSLATSHASSLPSDSSTSFAGAAGAAAVRSGPAAKTVVPSDAALAAALVMLRLYTPGLGHQKLTAALHVAQPFWAVNAQRVRRTMKLAHLAPGAPPPSNKALSQLLDVSQSLTSPEKQQTPSEPLSARAHALREAATAYKYDAALEMAEVEDAAAAADAEAARVAAFQAEIVVEVKAQTSAAEAAKMAKLEAEAAAKEARRAALACGASADLVSYNACLGALERGHQACLAMQLFQELVDLSAPVKRRPSKPSQNDGASSSLHSRRRRIEAPDRVSVNAVLSALARVGDWTRAMEVAETHLDGMAPVMATVRADNFAYVDQMGTGKLLFSTAETAASTSGLRSSSPLPAPDRATFTLLAKACCMGGEPWLGLEMKAALHQRLGQEADPTLLRTLICACEDAQKQTNTPSSKASQHDTTPTQRANALPMAGKSLVQAALMLREELQQLAPRELVRRSHSERRAAAAARSRLGATAAPVSGEGARSLSSASSSPPPSSDRAGVARAAARATAAGTTINDRKLRELGFTSGESPGVVSQWSFARQAIDDVVLEAKARKEQPPSKGDIAEVSASHILDEFDKEFNGAGGVVDSSRNDNGSGNDDAALEIELEGVLDDLGRAVCTCLLLFLPSFVLQTYNYFETIHALRANVSYSSLNLFLDLCLSLLTSLYQVQGYRTSESSAMRAIQEAPTIEALDAAFDKMTNAGLSMTLWHFNAAIATAGTSRVWNWVHAKLLWWGEGSIQCWTHFASILEALSNN